MTPADLLHRGSKSNRALKGQDEVPRGAVVTNYEDSVLIPSAIIQHTNDEIRKLGGEKVCDAYAEPKPNGHLPTYPWSFPSPPTLSLQRRRSLLAK